VKSATEVKSAMLERDEGLRDNVFDVSSLLHEVDALLEDALDTLEGVRVVHRVGGVRQVEWLFDAEKFPLEGGVVQRGIVSLLVLNDNIARHCATQTH